MDIVTIHNALQQAIKAIDLDDNFGNDMDARHQAEEDAVFALRQALDGLPKGTGSYTNNTTGDVTIKLADGQRLCVPPKHTYAWSGDQLRPVKLKFAIGGWTKF